MVGGCSSASDEAARVALSSTEGRVATPAGTGAQAPPSKLGPEAKKTAAALTAAATPGSSGYKIGPQDVLEISVFKVPELSKIAQVGETGTVGLPLIGDVQAAGRTPQEIEHDLAKRLGAKYLQNPQVSVFVREYNSQRITVEGAVKKPGVFPYRGPSTLLQAIAQAGGLETTYDDTIVIFRTTNGKRSAAKFAISEIRAGSVADPALHSGDVVVISTNAIKEAFGYFVKAIPVANAFVLL